MSQLQGTRLPIPGRAGRASSAASVSLDSSDGSVAASSAFRNEPQELLGLSSGTRPMSITSPIPRNLSNSASSGQQAYAIDIPPDYGFPQDLGLQDPKGSQQVWPGYQVNDNDNDNAPGSLRRLTSAEPEQPWSGIHLNGLLPSEPRGDQRLRDSTAPMTVRNSQQRSVVGSHANETDSGYYTYSQPDIRSTYSSDSGQMHRIRPGPSSIPRSIPLTQEHPNFAQYRTGQSLTAMDYPFAGPMEQRLSSQTQREPHTCTEPGCTSTFKTMSDLKKHTARHKREHVCRVHGCTRANNGFPTINDLERHQKSVHRMEPSHGQSRMYKCFAANCKQRDKEWPRLDNFKQHLQRMHKDMSTEDLIHQSNDWYDTEKRPCQPASPLAGITPSQGLHLLNSIPSLVNETSGVKSQNHLSSHWQPTRNAMQQQQSATPNRPRHSSLSSQPNSSASFPSIRKSSSAPFQSLDIGFGGSHQSGQTSMAIFSTQLPSGFVLDSSQPLARGRPTAYTVPNPDTSALSDLQEIGFSNPSGSFSVAQDDLVHIASNFTSESQSAFLPANQSPCSPFHSPNKTTGSSSSSIISIEDINAFINRSTNGYNDRKALEQIMKASIEKLAETQPQSNTATTTSSSPSVVTSTLTSHPDSTNTRLQYDCPEKPCTKTYPRRCDLKKHLKRHRRPYGCTFSKCYEKFGSKYDWKRHENSQHFQHECWKCALCSSSTARNGQASISSFSGQLFYRRNIFMAHMQKVHHLPAEAARDHAQKQRIGRNCQTRFWCGFCKVIVELQKKGLEGADERFNHIDKHFKQKCHISTWVEMDGSEAKGQGTERNRDEEQEEDTDDVLGSDGIGDSPVMVGEDDNDGSSRGGYGYVANNGGGDVNARNDTGQKRTLSSDFEVSSRPAQQRRTDSVPAKSFICCQCKDGPQTLRLRQKCTLCTHPHCEFCSFLDHRGRNVGRTSQG